MCIRTLVGVPVLYAATIVLQQSSCSVLHPHGTHVLADLCIFLCWSLEDWISPPLLNAGVLLTPVSGITCAFPGAPGWSHTRSWPPLPSAVRERRQVCLKQAFTENMLLRPSLKKWSNRVISTMPCNLGVEGEPRASVKSRDSRPDHSPIQAVRSFGASLPSAGTASESAKLKKKGTSRCARDWPGAREKFQTGVSQLSASLVDETVAGRQ